MTRRITRAREKRIKLREEENACHEQRRSDQRATTLDSDVAYAPHQEAAQRIEKARREAEEEQRHNYEKRMKELTGLKTGIGEWLCIYGHRHLTTGDCQHGKSFDLSIGESLGSTSPIPQNVVLGQRVSGRDQLKWM